MPELAEVEYYRKIWNPGIGNKVKAVRLHPDTRIFRNCNAAELKERVEGSFLRSSEAHGKQMLFRFSGPLWVRLRLGMSGKLRLAEPGWSPQKHDHFALLQRERMLVFSDYRQFGEIRFATGKEVPSWWRRLPPPITSGAFDRAALEAFLRRHGRAPIKAVLLLQDRFPGIGNWMADEILWRARIKPRCPAGIIKGVKLSHLLAATKSTAKDALAVIASDWGDIPDTWLFNHRWKEGGLCPVSGKPLQREKIGGRTTCWSPHRQTWPKEV